MEVKKGPITVEVKISDNWLIIFEKIVDIIIAKIRKSYLPQFTSSTGLLLAGGLSKRWREKMSPDMKPLHKSCAPIGEQPPPLQRALIAFHKYDI